MSQPTAAGGPKAPAAAHRYPRTEGKPRRRARPEPEERPQNTFEPVDRLVGVERRRGRSWYRVVAESGRSWVVDREALAQLRFLPDTPEGFPVPLSAGERALLEEAEQGTARRRLLSLLAHRARSRQELARLLALWPFPAGCVEDAVRWAVALGYVNDEELAGQLVEQVARNPMGRLAVVERLARRGIEPNLARRVVDEQLPPEQEQAQATQLARQRLAALRGLDETDQARRLYALLLRRGFDHEVARAAVRAVLGARGRAALEPDG